MALEKKGGKQVLLPCPRINCLPILFFFPSLLDKPPKRFALLTGATNNDLAENHQALSLSGAVPVTC